ncbi:MAG: PilZ domain-containing protein [Bdellovibrio sp.]|nr:PilZ domain-containing protein [Bdellovibrio sp.]
MRTLLQFPLGKADKLTMNKETPYASNRRKFPRKAFRKTLSFISKGDSEVVDGVEIGEGGISFRSNRKMVAEQKLIVNFFLPEGDFFSVRTTLKNVQNSSQMFTYGVSFDDVPLALKRQIRAYVARTFMTN